MFKNRLIAYGSEITNFTEESEFVSKDENSSNMKEPSVSVEIPKKIKEYQNREEWKYLYDPNSWYHNLSYK